MRHPACIAQWPECEDGAYNPSCCRFPKSCSCEIRQQGEPVMRQEIQQQHFTDEDGNPAGGSTSGRGISISWQNGPLQRSEGGTRLEPNGAFVEGVIEAAIGRLDFYQSSKFECDWNQVALDHLHAALAALEARTSERESRGVEGTHEV